MNHIDRQSNINNQTNKQVRVGVHIGLPKTGTTSLQELYFNRHPDLVYLGQTNIWDKPEAKNMLKGLILGDNSDVSKEEILKIRDDALARKSALVISDEALTMGEFMLRSGRWPIVSNHYTAAKRIHNLLGDVHVLVVLRNQADWLESWQRQGLKTAKYVETDFKRWLKNDIGPAADHLFELLNYDELYDAYVNIFGKDKVHVRLYEDYKDNLEELAMEFANVLGIDPEKTRGIMLNQKLNISGQSFVGLPKSIFRITRSRPARNILRKIPKRFKEPVKNLIKKKRFYLPINDEQKKQIREYFHNDNCNLFKKLNLETRQTGYY